MNIYEFTNTEESTPIHAVYARRELYDNYPPCQREYVWDPPMKQRLIDSILRGLPVPAIMLIPSDDELTGRRYQVVDGQQRLRSILDFMDNKYKTGKYNDEPGIPPIEPDRYFRDLSLAARSRLELYKLRFWVFEKSDNKLIGMMYRRLQYQKPLTFAEKLFSYNSETRDMAIKLQDHSFWSTIYAKGNDRKQIFQMGVYIAMIELSGIFANMTTPRLRDITSGQKDDMLVPGFADRIKRRLDGLENVFHGATLDTTLDIIVLYQSCCLLEEASYDLHKSKEGCLAPWYMRILQERMETRSTQTKTDILGITKVNKQIEFWATQFDKIKNSPGLFRLDNKRYFDKLDKIKAWNRQDGKCPVCKKPVRIQDVGHHVVMHSLGGPTTPDNCVLVHDKCHDVFHTKISAQLSFSIDA